ncbi:DUF2971 domain-containing protein [Pseudomonas sp. CDFA 553]|uniref:DUF2971 domain-containing protein n=1 Tax=Pseudomonas quasicaspiana TaxID=2829821 RepID=UPI001E6399A6|nr:DUF2971 domain-containing protein [Pseudomonas quasicaspiana]MCD5986411.1 DUF2971 domain-containing protein [Pseudomonas quasicaspiana]
MVAEGFKRVYHFCDAKYGIENLKNRRLKVATIMELNDPFELIAHDMRDQVIRAAVKRFKAISAEAWGFLCFSRSYSSPVQWAHYGDKHRGICLGFDIPAGDLHRITYTDNRLGYEPNEVDTEEKRHAWSLGFFTTKHSHWHYEEEERMIVDLKSTDREQGLHFCPFDRAGMKLAEIIVGCNSQVTRKQIKEFASIEDHNVNFIKARPAFGRFEIVKNLNSNIW